MQNGSVGRGFILAALSGLAAAVPAAQAQVVLNRFDNASEVSQWRFDFGSVTHTEAFDPAVDANGNAASGSMRVTLTFNSTLAGNNKGAYTRDIFPGLNGAAFTGLTMDVLVAPSSALDAFGNNGFFSLVVRNTGNYDYNQQFGDNVRSGDGWRHINVSPLMNAVNDIRGVTWQLYGGPSQNINGTVTLWIDNVVFTAVPEPSALALSALAVPGWLAYRRLRRGTGAPSPGMAS
jgi:hypothetical protein